MRGALLAAVAAGLAARFAAANPPDLPVVDPFDFAFPNESVMPPFEEQVPVAFLTRSADPKAWDKLPAFWNDTTETVPHPVTGDPVTRKAVVIKVPLGLSTAPVSPPENPLTVAKFALGKRLYFDKVLSTNNTVSCATCHHPDKGFTDRRPTSLGINEKVGGMNAPTVINSGLHRFQFWDGRAATLEEQAQGPVANAVEMFGGDGSAWDDAVRRLRKDPGYVRQFQQVFGHPPTRDAAAKAIAAYERTVLSANSIHDRAERAMRARVADEGTGDYTLTAADYADALKAAFAANDANALTVLGVDPATDAAKADALGDRLARGRGVFFGKARCTNCHVGDNFTDGQFHNLGVGADGGKLGDEDLGRYARLPTGHKDPSSAGAFKTPGLRALPGTAPYMHNGEEKTLEAVVDFYDRGGNPNEFLSPKMRDTAAEDEYLKAKATGRPYAGPEPALFARGGRPVIPFRLNLTAAEKADLVLFLKALHGDPVDPIVADPARFPADGRVSAR